MSYFTETFNLILEEINADKIKDYGYKVALRTAFTPLFGDTIAKKYPRELVYIDKIAGKTYHGYAAYTIWCRDVLRDFKLSDAYMQAAPQFQIKGENELKKCCEEEVAKAISDKRYKLNDIKVSFH